MIHVGLIGAGMMGRVHAQSLQVIEGAKLVLAADPSAAKLKEISDSLHVRTTLNTAEVVESPEIQAVVVATPTPLHFAWVQAALEAGKHVFCELPLARQTSQAEEMVNLARQRGLVLTVNHCLRAFYEISALHEQVRNGTVGRPGLVHLSRRTPHPRSWYSNLESSGGVILDAMIHDLDFLLWTFGPAERVSCKGLCSSGDVGRLDYALAIIRLAAGALAHLESSWSHYGQYVVDVRIAGDKGLITYSNLDDSSPLRISLIDWRNRGRRYFTESTILDTAYMRMMRGFLAAAEGRNPNPVEPEEALAALNLALAAIESARTGSSVYLPVADPQAEAT